MAQKYRSTTMNTTKALFLAGLAVMSLGAGVANAQNLTPSAAGSWYTSQMRVVPNTATTAIPTSQPQPALPPSGGSDEGQAHSWLDSGWVGDNSPYRFQ